MARKLVILLSGPLAVGKTTLRDVLINDHRFDYAKSGDI
jgi:guanylate kinase